MAYGSNFSEYQRAYEQAILIHNSWLAFVRFSIFFIDIQDSGCVLLQGKVIIIVDFKWIVQQFPDGYDNRFDEFSLQVWRKESIVIFVVDMNNYFISKPTCCNAKYLSEIYLAFDPVGKEGVGRGCVDHVYIGNNKCSFLPLIDVIDFNNCGRHQDYF